MDDREFDAQPNLLHVSVFLTAAVRIWLTLLGLEQNEYPDIGVENSLLSLMGAAKLVEVYLAYLHMGFTFFAGRVYCRHTGALTGIQEHHRLVGELNVGGWSAEDYA
jgi:hypothetical protein